ncbi:unnamed protein product [Prorocentrum cordatum]|uniref:Rab3 GTPase-activating protein catalytic subunit n=1 Tax=Prorocentrum cordatum TaxID=2364126 RepID=A0ABN9VEV7_9DINO|nr:unnamed protein product [Polarella glacialis]
MCVEQRRAALDGMERDVRARLLSFMGWCRRPPGGEPRALGAPPDPLLRSGSEELERQSSASGSDCEESQGPLPIGSGVSPDHRPPSTSGDGSTPARSYVRGVVAVQNESRRSYYASCSFWNLACRTRSQESFQVALEQHILLVQIRDMANKLRKGHQNKHGPHTTAILREACDSVLAASNMTREEMGMYCTAKIQLGRNDCKCRAETPVLPWEESLAWRARLLEVRTLGWHSLRACWVELLQHPGYKRKRPLSAEQAAGFVDALRHIAEPAVSRMMESGSSGRASGPPWASAPGCRPASPGPCRGSAVLCGSRRACGSRWSRRARSGAGPPAGEEAALAEADSQPGCDAGGPDGADA